MPRNISETEQMPTNGLMYFMQIWIIFEQKLLCMAQNNNINIWETKTKTKKIGFIIQDLKNNNIITTTQYDCITDIMNYRNFLAHRFIVEANPTTNQDIDNIIAQRTSGREFKDKLCMLKNLNLEIFK